MSSFQTNYIYNKAQCELCNALYPDFVEYRGIKHKIFDYKTPEGTDYMILEVLGFLKTKNFSVIKLPHDYELEIG